MKQFFLDWFKDSFIGKGYWLATLLLIAATVALFLEIADLKSWGMVSGGIVTAFGLGAYAGKKVERKRQAGD